MISPEDFAKIAADAKAGCPVSKALAGTTITLNVKLGLSPRSGGT